MDWWNFGPDLAQLGVRLDELPDDLFEARVFCHLLNGVAGRFTVNGSIFAQNWRYMPAAESVARKLGGTALADELALAWAEVQTLPREVLDDFDERPSDVIWEPGQIADFEGKPDWWPTPRIIPATLGERMIHLLDTRWDKLFEALPPAPPDPLGDSSSAWENAFAAHLSRIAPPFELVSSADELSARHREIVLSLDDYASRTFRCYSGCDLARLLDLAGLRFLGEGRNSDSIARREAAAPVSLRDFIRASGFDPAADPEPEKRAIELREAWLLEHRRQRALAKSAERPKEPLLLVETETTGGMMLQAHYRDRVALVDPESGAELAAIDLPRHKALNPINAHRWLYAEAPAWRADADLRPVPAH